MVVGSALAICFGFARREDTFDGSAFCELKKWV